MARAVPGGRTAATSALPAVAAAIGASWLAAIVAEASGAAGLIHHHALIQGGPAGAPPLWLGLLASTAGWLVMVGAMMLPASLPTIAAFERSTAPGARRARETGSFIAAFAVVWVGFGVAAFGGDLVLHRIVDGSIWLRAHPLLIPAALLGVAGVYQFLPLKHHSLAACRPGVIDASQARHAGGSGARDAGARAGVRHAIDCLGASWAVMLLMFGAGLANLAWMVALTGVMAYETWAADGHDAARVFGVSFLCLALAVGFGALALA